MSPTDETLVKQADKLMLWARETVSIIGNDDTFRILLTYLRTVVGTSKFNAVQKAAIIDYLSLRDTGTEQKALPQVRNEMN